MKVFIAEFRCSCHDLGLMAATAFNRGHAVKLIGQKLRALGCEESFDKKTHAITELDLDAKKGSVTAFWFDPSDGKIAGSLDNT